MCSLSVLAVAMVCPPNPTEVHNVGPPHTTWCEVQDSLCATPNSHETDLIHAFIDLVERKNDARLKPITGDCMRSSVILVLDTPVGCLYVRFEVVASPFGPSQTSCV